ncbi:MAG TPA: ATP-binding protein [Vicinamibacterales bacterium]|nr:ATP-binding protein [Vicinamibacterales bacterium]
MIRGIYAKIFLWFCLASAIMGGGVFVVTALVHAQSLGPRWMTGVLDMYARSAVHFYTTGGPAALQEYLDQIEQSSRIHAALLDPELHDVLGHGLPSGTQNVLAEARAMNRSRFRTDLNWIGASIVQTPDGTFILVAQVLPYRGLWSWSGMRTPALRLTVALVAGALLCLILARHIAAPIRTLQLAARRIADGDLTVRALPAISPRRDELSELARDFDRMADRIQALMLEQQELLGEISHELRSPLTRLSVSLELVRRGQADASERMQSDLRHLDTLIDQILTLTRLQTHGHQRAEAPVNLWSILERVVDDARFEGKDSDKSVVIVHADRCWMSGDPALLRSSIENVVRNALHHTKPHTSVVVSLNVVRQPGAVSARILIGDQGPGVPPDALPRLFEPFYRVSESRVRPSNGTGLGLSIAQRIVASYGGTITARNRAGGGLEVEISLPVNEAPANAVA